MSTDLWEQGHDGVGDVGGGSLIGVNLDAKRRITRGAETNI